MVEHIPSQYTEMVPAIVRNLRKRNNLAKANHDPIKYFEKYGITLPQGIDYEIAVNSDEDFYFVIPIAPNDNLTIDQLRYAIGGAQSVRCVSSASTVACFGNLLSYSCVTVAVYTASTFSTAGSLVASAGTASTAPPS